MLATLMEMAKLLGHKEIVLSAQTHAVPFYRKYGFTEEGAEYMEAGIPHQDMRRAL
jgi:predicted GNAT family N-acyltransferase